MANRNRWDTPYNTPYNRDADRPYSGARQGRDYGSYPRNAYGSAPETGSERWSHERDYYGNAPYGENRNRMSGDRYQSGYGGARYSQPERGGYGTQAYGSNRPYSAYEANQSYRQSSAYEPMDNSDLDYADPDRGFFERAGDEVRSWFGDDEAARRREMDHRDNDYSAAYDYSADYTSSTYAPQRPSTYASPYASRGQDIPAATSGRGRYRGSAYGRQGAYAGVGPKDYFRSDDRIREDACDRLTDDPRINARNVELRVDKGEVTLNGTVDDRAAKRRVEDCVERISGVKNVQNNLRVETGDDYTTSAYSTEQSALSDTSTTIGATDTTAKASKTTM